VGTSDPVLAAGGPGLGRVRSLAAFDGLELFLAFGTGLSGSGWSLTDTVLVIAVAIGVLCAAVGAVAVTSAARDDRKPAGT
jgi:hypothetical protein